MTTSYRPTGLIRYHAAGTYRGYTLFSPNGGDDAYLIDMEGNFVHRWHYPGGIAYGFLLDNGNLLFRDRGSNPPGADHIRELDWDSRLVWEYHNPSLRRHDRLPNGNNLFLLQRDRIPAELTRRVRGGFTTASDPEQMFSDQVVEVTSAGVEVDVWRSADHLVPETDMICPLERRDAWGGANDLTSSPDGSTFLISFRILDTVALVDRSTSEITWKWGPGNISHQHHPTYLDNGHVLLLDNGAHRRGLSYSRVIEVDPSTSEIVWQYQGLPMVSFFTHFTGGAQRLSNGNTLITEGLTGRLFEVTPGNEVVWEFVSPFVVPSQFGMANGVFRAHRYGPDHPALQGKELDPERFGNFNRLYGRR